MLRNLKKWLAESGNSNAKLAYLLGYKSSATISNWLTRRSIPQYILPQLKEALKK